MAIDPVFVGTPKLGLATIVNADGTTVKTLYTAGANGSKITGVSVQGNDTVAHVIELVVTRSAVVYAIIYGTLAITGGGDGVTPALNLFSPSLVPGLPLDNDGQTYLFLQSGDVLGVAVTVAVTAAKTLTVAAVGADF